MKKIIYLLSLIALIGISGCERELESENVSKVTTYANFKLQGNDLVVIANGENYVDAGAKAFEGSKEIEVTALSNVDNTKMGVYSIKYSAKNSDGFEAFSARTVIVMPAGTAIADDLSGSYQRNAGAKGTSVWTKIQNGLYKVADVGGANKPQEYVYVFNPEPNVLIVPAQPLGGSGTEVYCTNADGGDNIDFVPGAAGTISYIWVVHNSGYGTAARKFVKL